MEPFGPRLDVEELSGMAARACECGTLVRAGIPIHECPVCGSYRLSDEPLEVERLRAHILEQYANWGRRVLAFVSPIEINGLPARALIAVTARQDLGNFREFPMLAGTLSKEGGYRHA